VQAGPCHMSAIRSSRSEGRSLPVTSLMTTASAGSAV
jgi:hypothetical protein